VVAAVSPSLRHCPYCGSPMFAATCGSHRDLPALDRMPQLDAEVRRARAKAKR
jgi:hypothetical protein